MDDKQNKKFPLYTSLTEEDILKQLNTSLDGLTKTEYKKRYATYGPNKIQQAETTWLTIIKNQLKSPFVYIFIIIAVAYLFTHQLIEGIIVLVIVLINSLIGFYQEFSSNHAMRMLKKYLEYEIKIKRDGEEEIVPVSDLVPGDIILLTAGDIIPADCRFIVTENLAIDQASLTGESIPVKKTEQPIKEKSESIYDASNIGFTGTIVVSGDATAVVFATASATEFGAIASLVTKGIIKNDLAQGTKQLARILILLIGVSIIVILLINIFIGKQESFFKLFLFSAALAITAIPEALPIVITFCLARGATRLQKHKVIVKRLSAIEDLGSVEVLCADKTGTLTEDTLSVKNIYSKNPEETRFEAALASCLAATKKKHKLKGFDYALMQDLTPEQIKELKHYSIIREYPFSYEKLRSISVIKNNNNYLLFTKGIPEKVTALCTSLSHAEINKINSWIADEEQTGNRVISFAKKTISSFNENDEITAHDKDYEFAGAISFADPLKKTAEAAIKKAAHLNVKIKILSGDSAQICYTIAHSLGLETDKNNVVVGTDFEKKSEKEKISLIKKHTIFARVTPQQKYEIINYLQRFFVVAYVGDGINDAPSLKIANVGIAVKGASAIAQETAEIILLEKSLTAIIMGIQEGRTTIINTLKYIKITISTGFGNFYSLAISSLLLDYLPMLPMQLLFLNLLSDFPLLSVSTDSVDTKELEKPLHYNIKDIGFTALIFGPLSSPFDFTIFMLYKAVPTVLQTTWFMTSLLMQMAFIFSMRTKRFFLKGKRPSFFLISLCILSTIIAIGLPFTALGQKIFLFKQPNISTLPIIFIIVSAYFVTTETVKLLYYRWQK